MIHSRAALLETPEEWNDFRWKSWFIKKEWRAQEIKKIMKKNLPFLKICLEDDCAYRLEVACVSPRVNVFRNAAVLRWQNLRWCCSVGEHYLPSEGIHTVFTRPTCRRWAFHFLPLCMLWPQFWGLWQSEQLGLLVLIFSQEEINFCSL